jgi:hypothetical protein
MAEFDKNHAFFLFMFTMKFNSSDKNQFLTIHISFKIHMKFQT